jgi:hypothetical protein
VKFPLPTLLVSFALAACGGSDPVPSNPASSSDNPRHNVMVVDDGIDETITAFQLTETERGSEVRLPPIDRAELRRHLHLLKPRRPWPAR